MKIVIHNRVTEIEYADGMFNGVKHLDINALIDAAHGNAQLVENAPAEPVYEEPIAEVEESAPSKFSVRAVAGTMKRHAANIAHGFALSASAVTDGQTEFDWHEATDDDIAEYIQAYGGADEYDYDEMSEVLESLQATGLSPQKPLGDLAQTSVVTGTGQVQVIGLSGWTIDWKRKTVEATTTDDAENESSLGSTKSWTAKANFMFIDADPSQQTQILAAITTQGFAALPWNFFPTIATGRAAFQGTAIIDGITITSGVGKICALDVSLKGTGPLLVLSQAAPVANATTVTGESAQV